MISKLRKWVEKTIVYRKTVVIASRIFLPGFGGISLYETSVFFNDGLQKGALPTRAAALSFNFFLALFPSIIFLFTLIPYIPIEDFQLRLMETIRMFMPANAFAATEETIHEILTRQNGGLLSFGFLMALYFSTNGFNSMINAFNNTYHEVERRNPLMQRLISLAMVFILTVIIIAGIGTLVMSEYLMRQLLHQEGTMFSRILLDLSRWALLFILCWVFISSTYFLAPARRNKGWKFFSPGSLTATILSIVTSLGFAYFVNNFGTYNKVYGSLGTLIVIMVWMYLNSLVLLVGFEINASIHSAKRKKILRSETSK